MTLSIFYISIPYTTLHFSSHEFTCNLTAYFNTKGQSQNFSSPNNLVSDTKIIGIALHILRITQIKISPSPSVR